MDAVQTLLKTKHFHAKPFVDKFEISANENEQYIDTGAIVASIGVVEHLLSEAHSSRQLCDTLMDVNYIAALCGIPGKIKVIVVLKHFPRINIGISRYRNKNRHEAMRQLQTLVKFM